MRDLAARREDLKAEIAALAAKVKKIDEKIIAELDRRGTRQFENDGWKVTLTVGTTTSYNFDALERKLGAEKAALYQLRAVDVSKLSQAVQARDVKASVVAAIQSSTPKAPYITCTPTSS
jgi:transposase